MQGRAKDSSPPLLGEEQEKSNADRANSMCQGPGAGGREVCSVECRIGVAGSQGAGGWVRCEEAGERAREQATPDGALDGAAGPGGCWGLCQLSRPLRQSLPLGKSWGRGAGGEGRRAAAWSRGSACSPCAEPWQRKHTPRTSVDGRNRNSTPRKPSVRLEVVWGL